MFRPMLAGKADLTKIKYPVLVSPKIDGVRAIVKDGVVLSRTLEPIPNEFVQEQLGSPHFLGLDGELIVGSATDDNCMQVSMSGVMSEEGRPPFVFMVFDYFTDQNIPYSYRYKTLKAISDGGYFAGSRVKLLEHYIVNDESELLAFESGYLEQGYEGLMIRSLQGPYKCGRSTVREGYLLKLKQFQTNEAEVIGFEELMTNQNKAEKSMTGYAKRSSKKEFMVPAGILGALIVQDLQSGVKFKIGSGFSESERVEYWKNSSQLLGQIVTYKHFAKGVVKKPRFPIFVSFRDRRDL